MLSLLATSAEYGRGSSTVIRLSSSIESCECEEKEALPDGEYPLTDSGEKRVKVCLTTGGVATAAFLRVVRVLVGGVQGGSARIVLGE